MLLTDRDALICDLAETYRIYDLNAVPLELLSVFACGLREDSRIRMKINGADFSLDTIFLAGALDRLSLLLWMNSQDGQKNRNRPESLTEKLLNTGTEEKKDKVVGFENPEDFRSKWVEITKGVER